MTGERRETTISILSKANGSDEDLSIVSSDPRTRSQSQVDYEWLDHRLRNYTELIGITNSSKLSWLRYHTQDT